MTIGLALVPPALLEPHKPPQFTLVAQKMLGRILDRTAKDVFRILKVFVCGRNSISYILAMQRFIEIGHRMMATV